jgi:4-hydroxy-tetrahydrodipicolinate reductase
MRIALYGYGKMGRAIESAATARGHDVVLRVDRDNAGTPPTGTDVAIEFSRPDQAVDNIALCLRNRVPVVVGTTGWYDRLGEVRSLVGETGGALLWASNFSIGVNLFFQLNKYLTQLMDPHAAYQARLDEVHHIHKLDAPSGTAITLARDIDLASARYTGWVLDPATPPETPGPLPIHSERTGEVPGTHSITWQSPEDRITITHEAFGREGFATGAVVAAEWVQGRTGLFTMADVLRG